MDGFSTLDRVVVLYTKQAPLRCHVYTRQCAASLCQLVWDDGESLCIHVSTSQTCAGDEIGWIFVNHVMSSGMTFSAFCENMSQQYKLSCSESRPFMSPQVFIQWFFGWASNQKIDFRMPCPVCKYEPPYLACDGTKIGVRLNVADVTPIECVDGERDLPSPDNRNSRCFMAYTANVSNTDTRLLRQQLLALSDPGYQTLGVDFTDLLNNVPQSLVPSLTRLLSGNMGNREKGAFCRILSILGSTTPLQALIPARYHIEFGQLLTIINIASEDVQPAIEHSLNRMREYCPEIRSLLLASRVDNSGRVSNDIIAFLSSILERLTNSIITPPNDAVPQEHSYNPGKFGRAYYFNPTGSRIRQTRSFVADQRSRKNQNYDDDPMPHEQCSKDFPDPKASARGTCFSFFWFCPLHHHCYGFHLIPGSEGRKDPHSSLYCHLEKPPKAIFYDFGCGLHEYSLNRESGYFQNVQFFHDIFHGYAHKCSDVYKSSRLSGFDGVNSSVCEQFNSFMQCIKKSARQMSQEHFVFYMQYFIHMWNLKKKQRYSKRLQVALNCME